MVIRLGELVVILTGTRLNCEIRDLGYAGGYTAVKVFLRDIRPGPAPGFEVRFEIPPGRQTQVDVAQFRAVFDKRATAPVSKPSKRTRDRFSPAADRRTRPQRWRDAVAKLPALQAEYTAWAYALTEALRDAVTAEALQAIVDRDLDTLADTEPPRRCGHD